MRRTICFLAVLLACRFAFPADSAQGLQYAMPRQGIFHAAAVAGDPGWTTAGAEYDLIGHSPNGYNVLLHIDGRSVIGQIPFRDEWGRPTADSSEIHLDMTENTLRAVGVTKFRPGVVVLKKGSFYPASMSPDGQLVIHYVFMDFTTNIAVTGSDVTFPAELPVERNEEEPAPEDAETADAPVPAPASTAVPEPPPAAAAPAAEKAGPPPEEPPKPAAEVPPEVKPTADGQLKHAGIGAKITASSVHTGEAGEGPASALIDGMLATRWSSTYSEPQHIIIEFEKPTTVRALRIYWETASATRYAISVSPDGQTWGQSKPVAKPVSQPAPRTDEVPMGNTLAKAIRLDLVTRVNPDWGFSLFEIEVVTP